MAFVSPRKRVRFRPRVEVLEDRRVPALLNPISPNGVNQTGSTLSIVCDHGPDHLEFKDNGRGNIDLYVDGFLFNSFSGVNTLNVNAGGGGDKVVYTLFDSMIIGQTRTVNVSLGDGKETFLANLSGRTLKSDLFGSAAASLTFNIHGNHKSSNIRFNAQNMTIQSRATLAENVTGGHGTDTVHSVFSGRLDGLLNLQLDGGPGHNVVKAIVDITDANSMGTLGTSATTSKLKGTGGTNVFSFIVHSQQAKPNNFIFAEIDANTSKDTAVFTSFTPAGAKTPAFVTVKGFGKGTTTSLPFVP
jgi:hypothetical protein